MNEHAEWRASTTCRVIISGAAGDAGSLCARELAKCGAHLALIDIDKVMVNRLAAEVGGQAYCFDVLSDTRVRLLMRDLAHTRFHADLLINAAGLGHVRTLGMMRLTRAFAAMTGSAPATVVNIASRPGARESPFDYARTKLAFHQLSEGLVSSLGRPNVQVLTLDDGEQLINAVGQWCRGASEDDPEACIGKRASGDD